jgi:LacI family transcriptional regulator
MEQDWQPPTGVDGYLVFEGARYLAAIDSASRAKAVCMGGTNFRAPGHDCVGFDLSAGSQDALTHLATQGFKRIAYVGAGFEEPRLSTYRTFMRENRLPSELILTDSQSRSDVRKAMVARLKAGPAPEALFCFNDAAALAAYRAIRDLGLSVPGDVAITGCDGIEDTEYLDVPITTIQLPLAEMCRRAWRLLQARMEDSEQPPQFELIRPELILRASSVRNSQLRS